MSHDLIIAGAGPVGATLALALRDADARIRLIDARRQGAQAPARSLALSHGARLVLERVGVWGEVMGSANAATPIVVIDISQRDGFGAVRLSAAEHDLPALGYVVSYQTLQDALDRALVMAGIGVDYDTRVVNVASTSAYAMVEVVGNGKVDEREIHTSHLAAIADGSGAQVAGVARQRHDYRQSALVAEISIDAPHGGVAFERFTPDGPVALLPEGERYGLIWTTSPTHAQALLQQDENDFLAALIAHFGTRIGGLTAVRNRRAFPLSLDYAKHVTGERIALIGNAAQSLHPIAGQGFNLGLRDAFELAQDLLDTPRASWGSATQLAAYARRRRVDRLAGIAFTHALLKIFANDLTPLSWSRGIGLAALDALPAARRWFTRKMLFGMH